MWQPETLILLSCTFALAGFVKGVVGLGLPTVSLALLTVVLGLKDAMALMLIPSIVTNIWQALVGGAFLAIVKRIWSLLLAAGVGVWIGAGWLAGADPKLLSGLLGLLLCIYSAISLATPQMPPPGRWEGGLSPLVGGVTGVITGLTGSFVVPAVLYLQALGLPRDMLVQAMGIAFTFALIALAVSLAGHNLLAREAGVLSGISLIPAALGMLAGQHVRKRIPERRFRMVFFCALLGLGAYLVVRALG